MRSLFLILFLCCLAVAAVAQRQYSTNNREAIKQYALANEDIDSHLYDSAIEKLKNAIEADGNFLEAHAQLGDIYNVLRRYPEAIKHYRRAIQINPEFNRGVYLKLGEAEIYNAEYAPAKADLEKYLTYPYITEEARFKTRKLIADCEFSMKAIQNPVQFKPVNMGPEINTANDEYLPVGTADESMIIFTRKIGSNEDFYKSIKQDAKWQNATYLSAQINTSRYNEGAQSISQDGKFLFFTGCNRPDGLGRCDIYVSKKNGDDWSKPFDLSPPINTPGWESQPSISADGRTLFFVSNRKGGYGGYDIWKSTLTDKGWGDAVNLGPNINTPFDEQSPFIHPDDSTFYFCSNGWPGLGNKDLFISRLGKNGQWQKPQNLGYPINSNGDENGLTISASGSYAFFASNNLNGYGGFDIYTFELPEIDRPKMVTYVKGMITDAKTKQPLEAAVEIIDLEKNLPVYQDYSSLDGNFLATLTSGKNYGLTISKNGYLFYSANLPVMDKALASKPYVIEVSMHPIEVGGRMILANIFFDTNRFDLRPESMSELQKLIDFMALNPTVKIQISGHTDDVGNDQMNQTLSENRAKSVYQYLINHKVAAQRLAFKGYGETTPIVPNTNDENRARNRRTEFVIVGK